MLRGAMLRGAMLRGGVVAVGSGGGWTTILGGGWTAILGGRGTNSETGAVVSTGRVSGDGLGGMVNLSAGRSPEETMELLEVLDLADLYDLSDDLEEVDDSLLMELPKMDPELTN